MGELGPIEAARLRIEVVPEGLYDGDVAPSVLFYDGPIVRPEEHAIELSRRQLITGAAIAATATIPPLRRSGISTVLARFAKGERVPDWLEISTTGPGIFGTHAELRLGGLELISYDYDLPDGHFFLGIRPINPLRRGEYMVRYPGGVGPGHRTFQVDIRKKFGPIGPIDGYSVGGGQPGAMMWAHDGADVLQYAMVSEPEYRIANARLAVRL